MVHNQVFNLLSALKLPSLIVSVAGETNISIVILITFGKNMLWPSRVIRKTIIDWKFQPSKVKKKLCRPLKSGAQKMLCKVVLIVLHIIFLS